MDRLLYNCSALWGISLLLSLNRIEDSARNKKHLGPLGDRPPEHSAVYVEQLEKLRQVNAQNCAQKAEHLLLELAGKEVALEKYKDYPHIRRNIVAEKRTIASKAAAMIAKWYEVLKLWFSF